MDVHKLRARLVREEGLAERRPGIPGRVFPYRDSVGKLSIGVGRNLDDKGISDAEAMRLLDDDIAEHLQLLDKYLPWWNNEDEARQLALADLAFNLGVGPSEEQPHGKLLNFDLTLRSWREGDYEAAARGLERSRWFEQVGTRAPALVAMVRSGVDVA